MFRLVKEIESVLIDMRDTNVYNNIGAKRMTNIAQGHHQQVRYLL